MSEILSWAFVIVSGGFFLGMMIYLFYLGLRPHKKDHPDDSHNQAIISKTKT